MKEQTALDYYIENENAKPISKYREITNKAYEIEKKQIAQAFDRGMAYAILMQAVEPENRKIFMEGEDYFRITHEEC